MAMDMEMKGQTHGCWHAGGLFITPCVDAEYHTDIYIYIYYDTCYDEPCMMRIYFSRTE